MQCEIDRGLFNKLGRSAPKKGLNVAPRRYRSRKLQQREKISGGDNLGEGQTARLGRGAAVRCRLRQDSMTTGIAAEKVLQGAHCGLVGVGL